MGMGDQECDKCGWETYGSACPNCERKLLREENELLWEAIQLLPSVNSDHPAFDSCNKALAIRTERIDPHLGETAEDLLHHMVQNASKTRSGDEPEWVKRAKKILEK